MKFRKCYDGLGKTTKGLRCEGDGLTVQSQRDEADINTLVRRFGVTGSLPQSVRVPTYGDFTGVSDFRTALDAIASAKESFAEMPAKVRRRFRNDPHEFVAFCSDPENLDEMRKLGLAVPPKPKAEDVKAAEEAAYEAQLRKEILARRKVERELGGSAPSA